MGAMKEDETREGLVENETTSEEMEYGSIADIASSQPEIPKRDGEKNDNVNPKSSRICCKTSVTVAIVFIVGLTLVTIQMTSGTILAVSSQLLPATHDKSTHHLVAVKMAFVQVAFEVGLITGVILCGKVTYTFGYVYPFWSGLITALVAITMSIFAFVWWILPIAHLLIGLSVAFIRNAGSTMVAVAFDDKSKRVKALAVLYSCRYGGIGLGFATGLYEVHWLGRSIPFMILFITLGIAIIVRSCIEVENNRDLDAKVEKPFQLKVVKSMLTDPQTMTLIGLNSIYSVTSNIYLSLVPLWVMEYLKIEHWQLATVRLTSTVTFILSSNIFGLVISKTIHHRWIYFVAYCLLATTSFISYPFITYIWQAFGPDCLAIVGFSLQGCFYNSWLSDVADKKFDQNYETIFALSVVISHVITIAALSTAGTLQHIVGYPAIFITVGILNCIYSFTSLIVRGH
ncbi:chromaffin granule amine transporter-like [Tubulanus polymorphus]|uniref:chromaffin granule amine transporter-like n=1 Tax=Tubulanus polymorphus TaxID=672921 RepID=UPI003DA56108